MIPFSGMGGGGTRLAADPRGDEGDGEEEEEEEEETAVYTS